MLYYRLYVKSEGSDRFYPVDWSTGTTVSRLMYATLFTEEERDQIVKTDLSHPSYADLVYEFRPVPFE